MRSDSRKRLRSGCSPSIGTRTQFQPGCSGNPGGRPRKDISEAYERLAVQEYPRDRQGRTYAERLAEAQFQAAIGGSTRAAREITDRLEGKPMQRLELDSTEQAPITLNLTVEFTDPPDDEEAKATIEDQQVGQNLLP